MRTERKLVHQVCVEAALVAQTPIGTEHQLGSDTADKNGAMHACICMHGTVCHAEGEHRAGRNQ